MAAVSGVDTDGHGVGARWEMKIYDRKVTPYKCDIWITHFLMYLCGLVLGLLLWGPKQ